MPRKHGMSRWSIAYFRLQSLFYIHGIKRQSRNLKAHSGDLNHPLLYVSSNCSTSIDIFNIYETHYLSSVVTRDLALGKLGQPVRYDISRHESRLAGSLLATHDSSLAIRDLKRPKSRVASCDLWLVTRDLIPVKTSRVTGHRSRVANPPVVTCD